MKKITLLIALMITSLGFAQQNFPFTFESPTVFNDFDLAVTSQVANPDPTGINTSATVAKIVRGALSYSGTKITVAAPIDFTVNKIIKMKVWFPVAGQGMLMKFEDAGTVPGDFEKAVTNVPAGVWTEVSFDYQGVSNNTRDQLVFLFNPGNNGDGTANSTYYFDDITFSAPVIVYDPIVLPLDFENTNQNFSFNGFGGGVLSKVVNPDQSAGNPSATVLKGVKSGPEFWAGGYFQMSSKVDFSLGKFIRASVWSPKAGGAVTLKLEAPGVDALEVPSGPLVAGWQEVSWDFSTLNNANAYTIIAFINDYGTVGDGTAAFTYYYDNLRQATTLSTAKFETSSVKMYPNPVRNTLTIDANSSIQNVSVYNILGQEVMRVSPKSNSVTLQTSDLQKGAYMVRTEVDGKVSTNKVIKE
jgi:hypothetical protein